MTATANTPASTPASVAPDAKPLPVLPGKRSTGKADRTGNPQADRAVRAATAAKKATKATVAVLNADQAAGGPAKRAAAVKAAPKAPAVKKVAAPAPAPEQPASAVTGAADAARKAKDEQAARRAAALATAGTAPTALAAVDALTDAALNRGDRVVSIHRAFATATLLPWKAAAHPVGKEGDTLKCYGACGRVLPVSRFPYIGPKADGAGRYVECGRDQVDRLDVNKVRKAAGLPLVERPRVGAEHLGK